jgi:uncharacterized protein YkwD
MNRRPWLLLAVASLALLTACGMGGAVKEDLVVVNPPPSTGGTPPSTGTAMSAAEAAMAADVFDRVNQERASAGLPPLAWHDGTAQVAYEHGVDMDVRNYFDHINPDGQTPWDRLTGAGISWSACGENIAHGQDSPAEVMNDWMNSSGHRANILEPVFTEIGVGVHISGGDIWWVQLFRTP